jgi:ATP-dependent DNA helicase PIF1
MKTEFLTGSAGTGKTYTIKERIKNGVKNVNGDQSNKGKKEKRNYGLLCATTGIAAINLQDSDSNESNTSNITTINSLLGYYDTANMEDQFLKGYIQRKLKFVASKGSNLIIDEVSMMEDRQLDILMKGVEITNESKEVQAKGGLGVVLTGDFCQLPPVKGKFSFYANCWEEKFGKNVTRLEKVWRQTNPVFLEMINCARRGDGEGAVNRLAEIDEVKFSEFIGPEFDGTTIFSKNAQVDNFNFIRLRDLIEKGNEVFRFNNSRWGKQRGEWKIIPEELVVCKNAYVMILANKTLDGEMEYANGDCGYVCERLGETIVLELKRNKDNVQIRPITRKVFDKEFEPIEGLLNDIPQVWLDSKRKYLEYMGSEENENNDGILDYRLYLKNLTAKHRRELNKPYFDFEEGKWVVGEITYLPIRLAYATTVHKCQGLTLDAIQVDIRDHFFGEPSMAYVALSRVREAKGLRIVGDLRLLEKRINILEDVLKWI